MKQNSYPFTTLPEPGVPVFPPRARRQDCTADDDYLRHLQPWLPRQVMAYGGICLNLSDSRQPYDLDIALFVSGHPDIAIDVEIDEPYEAVTLEPCHYLTCGDVYRDHLLARHGWIVVRFAEQQLRRDAQGCAAYLLQLLQSLVPGLPLPEGFEAAEPEPVCRWTRNESLKLAARQVSAGAPRRPVLAPSPLTDLERRCSLQVKPLPRSAEMTAKMAGFRDAGRYEQDAHIDFEPEEHIYIRDGREQMLSVSGLAAHFFERFNALQQAWQQLQRKGIPIEESLDKWDRLGCMACEVGTFVHAQTENYFRDGSFETDYAFEYGGQTEHVSVAREREHFLRFIEDYKINPYRQEWPVYDAALNIAGTIDLICQEADGTFTIYDWKRSSRVVNAQGQPIVDSFGGRMSRNGIHLPDTVFYHYCLQQNLYRYMLETNYGIRIGGMNLVVLCADYPTYYVAQVPRMDEVISQVVGVCRTEDLGHKLLR